MLIHPLASGSDGNSLLVRAAGQQVLVDVGLPLSEIETRLLRAGREARRTTAVLMTHRHRDHSRGVADFCRKYRVPVFGTRRTLRSLCNKLHKRLRTIHAGRPFRIGDLDVHAVQLRHDAPDTVGYRFDDGRFRFAIATDLGCVDGAIEDVFVHLDALLLEFNYDAELLANGPYQRQLRDRVAADTGHLSNAQAAELLRRIHHPRLRRLWVGHVSRRNNRPELALAAARAALGTGSSAEVVLALQDEPSAPLDLGAGCGREDATAT